MVWSQRIESLAVYDTVSCSVLCTSLCRDLCFVHLCVVIINLEDSWKSEQVHSAQSCMFTEMGKGLFQFRIIDLKSHLLGNRMVLMLCPAHRSQHPDPAVAFSFSHFFPI